LDVNLSITMKEKLTLGVLFEDIIWFALFNAPGVFFLDLLNFD
jgi:hypothetical protein